MQRMALIVIIPQHVARAGRSSCAVPLALTGTLREQATMVAATALLSVATLVVLGSPCARAAGLADPRIVGGQAAISLDGEWAATSADGHTSISATVPGDIITDLQRAGKIGDPLYELNWKDPKNVRLWNQSWTFERTLPAQLSEHASAGGETLLVFDGIKMGATVKLNGKVLGVATDQFVKYNFSISEHLLAHVDAESGLPLASKLEVSFGAENAVFAPCYAEVMIILPTQARDKPRVNKCG